MKKSFKLILALTAGILSLTACGPKENQTDPDPDPVIVYDKLSEIIAGATTQSKTVTKNLDIFVTFYSGDYAFIEDKSAGAIVRYKGHGFQSGYEFTGDITVTYQLGDYNPEYKGEKKEVIITKLDVSKATKVTKSITLGNYQLSDAKADFKNFSGRKARFKDTNIILGLPGEEIGEEGIISQGAEFIDLVSSGTQKTSIETGKTGDVIGYLAYFNGEQTMLIYGKNNFVERELPAEESAFTALNTIGVYNLENDKSPAGLFVSESGVQHSVRIKDKEHIFHISSIKADNDICIKFSTSKISCGALFFADIIAFKPVGKAVTGSANLVCSKRTDDLIWLKDSENKIGYIVPNK